MIRGIGEISNLLQLFATREDSFSEWKSSSRQLRLRKFSPYAVRQALESEARRSLAIDEERYSRLCEIGTHPVPGQLPGHYTGSSRPILGGCIQHVGVYVSFTELGFAISLCGTGLLQVMEIEREQRQELLDSSVQLMRSLGTFTVLNYEEKLNELLRDNA